MNRRWLVLKYDARNFAQRLARGARYILRRTSQTDASAMLYEMQNIAGVYPLASFSTCDVLDDALQRFLPRPNLERLCEDAAARVAHKWNDSGDSRSAAIDWALELVTHYAAEDGIKLELLDDAREFVGA